MRKNRRWDDAPTPRQFSVLPWVIGGLIGAVGAAFAVPRLAQRKVPPALPLQGAPARLSADVGNARMARLETLLRGAARTAPARTVAVMVFDLDGGAEACVNPDRTFLAASLIKLPVMGASYEVWQRKPRLKTAITRDWVERMITVSDNPATNALIRMVGGVAAVDRFCDQRGLSRFQVAHAIVAQRGARTSNTCTAREVVRFLVALDRRHLVSASADEEMWQVLLRQKKRARIPGGLPKVRWLRVGNKTGTLGTVLHDAGIVHTPRVRYALCVLLSGYRSEAAGDRFCRTVSRLVFETLHGAVAPQAAALP